MMSSSSSSQDGKYERSEAYTRTPARLKISIVDSWRLPLGSPSFNFFSDGMAGIIPLESRLVRLVHILSESDQLDLVQRDVGIDKLPDFLHRDARRPRNRVAVDATADGREGDRSGAELNRHGQGISVAGSEFLRFALVSTSPNRTDRMDDPLCREAIALGGLGFSDFASAEGRAFLDKVRSRGTVNGAIHTAAPQQG